MEEDICEDTPLDYKCLVNSETKNLNRIIYEIH